MLAGHDANMLAQAQSALHSQHDVPRLLWICTDALTQGYSHTASPAELCRKPTAALQVSGGEWVHVAG